MGSAIKRDGCCPSLGKAGGLKAGLRIALLAGPARVRARDRAFTAVRVMPETGRSRSEVATESDH